MKLLPYRIVSFLEINLFYNVLNFQAVRGCVDIGYLYIFVNMRIIIVEKLVVES